MMADTFNKAPAASHLRVEREISGSVTPMYRVCFRTRALVSRE